MRKRSLAILLSGVSLVACAAGDDAAPTGEGPAPVPVRVARAQRGEIQDILLAPGETAALSVLRLASPISGRVTSLALRAGDRIDAGAVLARVLPLESDAALHGFSLLERSGAMPGTGVADRLRRELGTGDIPLRAPFFAVVTDRLRNPGEQVAAGDVILELFDPASLYVIAQVPAERAAEIRPGLTVAVDRAGSSVEGEVAALEPSIRPDSLTVPVRISLETPLKPTLLGAAVRCRFRLAAHRDVLIVPQSALVSSRVGDRGVLFVAEEGRARERQVRLGLRNAESVEVVDGLSDDAVVLIENHYSLPDGTAIEPQR